MTGRTRSRIDFAAIAAAALNQARGLLPSWFPAGKMDGYEFRVGGLDGSPGQSLAINTTSGVWCDFAGDDSDRGSDLISLYAAIHGLDQADAAREVARQVGVSVPEKPDRKAGGAGGAKSVSTPKPASRGKGEGSGPAAPIAAPAAAPTGSGTAGNGAPDAPAGAGGPQASPPASAAPPGADGPPPADPPGGGGDGGGPPPAGSGGGGGDDHRRTFWRPILPVPDDAGPEAQAHPVRGRPSAVWRYVDTEGRLLGFVCRFTTSDGGKEILPQTYCEHEKTHKRSWRWISFPEPRPLYGLDRLRPGKPVLIVEGEKCADAAHGLPEIREAFDVLSWPGGGKAVTRAAWGTLAGRSVLIWPDADAKAEKKDPTRLLPEAKQPGVKAAETIATELAARGCRVRIVKIPAPGEKPDGWDVADAIAEGMTGAQILAWLRERQRAPGAPEVEGPGGAPPPDERDPGAWVRRLVRKKGDVVNCAANVWDVLTHSPEWRGVIAYDEFAQRTVKLKPPPYEGGQVGEWESADDTLTAMWITRQFGELGLTPSSTLITEAIEVLARRHAFHPVRDWLRSLKWDGAPRLDDWLEDCLGVAPTDYSRRVARWFLIGMVARVMRPGVKFDYCLVLEGPQGLGKSKMLRLLAGDWFSDQELDLSHKDSMSALRGKWLHEFAELGALARAEERRQKSFLSRQVDEFRPVYGRREISLPRQIAFSGSTNEWEWNKDPTGGRRFWPVTVTELNHDRLLEARDQLFAEALQAFLAGEKYWPAPDAQAAYFDPEQLRREQPEAFVDALHDWVFGRVNEFSLATACIDGLKMDAGKLTRDVQTRVGIALRKLGCTRVERRNGMTRYWYKPPEKSASDHEPARAPHDAPPPPLPGEEGGRDDAIPF